VIVPQADERPACAGILQVGVGKIALPYGAIAVNGSRPVEIAGLSRVGNSANLVDGPVVACRSFFRILNDLVDEVAEVQHKPEMILRASAFVFEDHPAITIELSFVDALATNKGEVHGPSVLRRGDSPADPAAKSVFVGEPVPINFARLKTRYQHSARPVRLCRNRRVSLTDDTSKIRVLRYLDMQFRSRLS
jgi:hypothetical protein